MIFFFQKPEDTGLWSSVIGISSTYIVGGREFVLCFLKRKKKVTVKLVNCVFSVDFQMGRKVFSAK